MDLDYGGTGAVFPRADRLLRRLERSGLWVSAAAVAVLGAVVIISIAGRTWLGRSIPDDNIIVGDLMIAIVALSWAIVTATDGNIAVEVFTKRVRPRGRTVLRVLASAVGLMMILPLAWASFESLHHALSRGTYYDGILSIPQWPGRMLFFYAFALTGLRLCLQLATDLRSSLGRQPDTGAG